MSREDIIPVYITSGTTYEYDLNEIMKFIKWDVDKNTNGEDFDVKISIEYITVGNYIICNQENLSTDQVLYLCKKHNFNVSELKPYFNMGD